MQRCISSLGCPELSLDEMLTLAARFGVPCIELRALGGTVALAQHLAATFGTPDRLAEHLRLTPIEIVAFNSSLHLAGCTADERLELAELARWANGAGVPRLRVFDGGKHADEAELGLAGETIRWWRELRQAKGWQTDIMVETHDSLLSSEAIRRFVAAFPDTAIVWDAHHTWRKGGEDPVETWKAIRSSVVHVHVKDSIAVPSAHHPFTYVLPGDGGFPMQRLRDTLRADGFQRPFSFEWEKLWHPYLPPLETALTTARTRNWW